MNILIKRNDCVFIMPFDSFRLMLDKAVPMGIVKIGKIESFTAINEVYIVDWKSSH